MNEHKITLKPILDKLQNRNLFPESVQRANDILSNLANLPILSKSLDQICTDIVKEIIDNNSEINEDVIGDMLVEVSRRVAEQSFFQGCVIQKELMKDVLSSKLDNIISPNPYAKPIQKI